MKKWIGFGVVTALASLFLFYGCGGKGGTGGGSQTFFLVRIELPGRDPLNLVVGQSVLFELAGYVEGTGERVKIGSVNWQVLPDPNGNGVMTSGGQFTPTEIGNLIIRARWGGSLQPQDLKVVIRPPNLPRVAGSVLSTKDAAGVNRAVVVIYNSSNVEVGRATVQSNGTFLALVPNTATKINFDKLLIPPGFFNEFRYRNEFYSANPDIPNCHALMVLDQALQSNVTSTMPDPIFMYPNTDPPPPPPTGCS